jgi:hypothetical protein
MRVVILITSILLFGAGATLAFFDKTGGATATYSAAVFGLIFVFLPEFKRKPEAGSLKGQTYKFQVVDTGTHNLNSVGLTL